MEGKRAESQEQINICNGTIIKFSSQKYRLLCPSRSPHPVSSSSPPQKNYLWNMWKKSMYVLRINKWRTGTYFDAAEAKVGFGSVNLFSMTQVFLPPIVNR